jgi:PucR C-terminal helix-turn-helix domain
VEDRKGRKRQQPVASGRNIARASDPTRTARHLDLHTNTVHFRLNRIRDLTGINPRSYAGLSLLLTTARMTGAGSGGRTVGR